MNISARQATVTGSRSLAEDCENCVDSKDDIASSESDDEIVHLRRKRPSHVVSESSSTSDENYPSPEQTQQSNTATTPPRSLRDRRQTSSSKKQKIMELRRLQRIRKRQNEKRAERQSSSGDKPADHEPRTSSTGQADLSQNQNDTTTADVNSAAVGVHLQNGSLGVSCQLNSDPAVTSHPDTEQIVDISEILVMEGDVPEDELQLIEAAVLNPRQTASANRSSGEKCPTGAGNDDGSESSGSDIVPWRSRAKKFQRSFIESDDDESSNHRESDDDSSEESPTDGDDDVNEDGDLVGFVVDDDDEELDETVSTDHQEEENSLGDAKLKFVVEKDLLSCGDDIKCIWSIEGKTMRKYICVSQENDDDCHANSDDGEDDDDDDDVEEYPDIFRGTLEVRRYSNKEKAKYQAINVCKYEGQDDDAMPDVDNTDVVGVVFWDLPFDESSGSETVLPMLTGIFAGGLQLVFKIYLQAIVSAAIDPYFLVCVYQEKDDYFLPALHKVDDELNDRKTFLVKSQAWVRNYKKCIEKYPKITDEEVYKSRMTCEACKLRGRFVSVKVYLSGPPYNTNTLETLDSSDDSSDSDDESPFMGNRRYFVGRFCFRRSSLYHTLHHFKWNLFRECQGKVEILRLVRPQIKRDQIIELTMEDDTWVDAMYGRLKYILDCAYKYTNDGRSENYFSFY